jgi:hypothetical protein
VITLSFADLGGGGGGAFTKRERVGDVRAKCRRRLNPAWMIDQCAKEPLNWIAVPEDTIPRAYMMKWIEIDTKYLYRL